MDIKNFDVSAAWVPSKLSQHSDWIYNLSFQEISELNVALSQCQNFAYETMSVDQFSIPSFGKIIKDKFLPQLEDGLGSLIIRGLNVNQYSLEELIKLYWGIGLHFGTGVSQNKAGDLLHHIYNHEENLNNPLQQDHNTNLKLWIHTDPCDVTALFCINKAKSGGENQLVSSISIHNIMLQRYPDLLSELYKPYYHRIFNLKTERQNSYYEQPIFAVKNDKFVCSILPWMVYAAQLSPNVPAMSEQQKLALKIFEQLAESPELCYVFSLEPGDLLFFNNYVTLHSRLAFIDHDEPERKRLLFRLWLSVANSRCLPDSYLIPYGDIVPGSIRGGIHPYPKVNLSKE